MKARRAAPGANEATGDEEMRAAGDNQLPGLVEEDSEMQPLHSNRKRGAGGVDDGDEDVHDEDGDEDVDYSASSSDNTADGEHPDASHMYGRHHPLSPFLPKRGYSIFAVVVLLCIVCYIAIPIVSLGASYDVISDRQSLAKSVVAPADWTTRLLALDRLDVRLKLFTLYGDGLRMSGQNASTAFSTTQFAVDGSVTSFSDAATSVLEDVAQVFSDASDLLAVLKSSASDAATAYTASVAAAQVAAYSHITNYLIPQASALFQTRAAARTALKSIFSTIFTSVFPVSFANQISTAVVSGGAGLEACQASTVCVSNGGLDLMQALYGNITNSLFRPVFGASEALRFVSSLIRANYGADDVVSAVGAFQQYLVERRADYTAVRGNYSIVIRELSRLAFLQQSSATGGVNTTVVTDPSTAEVALLGALPPLWASNLKTIVQAAQTQSDTAFAALTSEVGDSLTTLLQSYQLVGAGLAYREVHAVSLWNSIYAYDVDALGVPSASVQLTNTAAFNNHPVTKFFAALRAAYVSRITETTAEASADVNRVALNVVGHTNIHRIQATVAVCSILPALLLTYLTMGIGVRLRSSSFPYSHLVIWLLVTYGAFVAAASSMAMMAIHAIEKPLAISLPQLTASAATFTAAVEYSDILTKAMQVLTLVQPNLTSSASVVTSLNNRLSSATLVGYGTFDYTAVLKVLVANVSTIPFVQTSVGPMVVRDTLSGPLAFTTTSTTSLEGGVDERAFDALPLCNRSRIVASVAYAISGAASLQFISDVCHFSRSSIASRTDALSGQAAKFYGCSMCGAAISKVFQPACQLPSPLGQQNHPRESGSVIQNLMWTTRTGTALTGWNATAWSMVSSVTSARSTAAAAVAFDDTDWKLKRRLLVWFAVFGALLLQAVWFFLWRAVFEGHLHSNLLP